ncbi:MAG: hypothetical protein FRX48_00938 [Lasallia pustulata]|uniref:Tetratricopeptide-like helical domain n=1 Tax=Lasallia pustulata TaxID=136370 RepID=A0A5M8Q274_9LECA|nr:MAG: hypothetical protein FRX48_00938 [Lasallia pustulata]
MEPIPQASASVLKTHGRQLSNPRASLTRRATKGPLDIDDYINPKYTSTNPWDTTALAGIDHPARDFSYLLRPEIYHPLTQLEIPPAFRASSKQPTSSTPLPSLLSSGHFRAAAIASAQQLTTSTSPTDRAQIFSLLYIRLATLTLINATPLAAQEAKVLEDLNSSFYRDPVTNAHVIPWELRVLAVRLQGIGYGDRRRAVMGYYDLAREARVDVAKNAGEARQMWKGRLEDLGVRVGNALVEMGDLEGAGRHLESLRLGRSGADGDEMRRERIALLYLRIGDVAAAKRFVGEEQAGSMVGVLQPLVRMAEGRYEDAVEGWKALRAAPSTSNPEMATQNLAVCLLYTGRLDEARSLLEKLVDEGHSFHALTFNLSTMYELCTDKSRALKTELTEKVASLDMRDVGWEKTNVEFKL